MLTLDIVEGQIRGLGGDRVPEVTCVFPLHHPRECGVSYDSHTSGVGDEDGCFQKSALFDPMSTRHIAVAIAGEKSSEHTLGSLFATRQHGSYAGANRALADDQPAFAGNECLVPDLDARHIRDGVQRSGCPIEGHPEITRARL